MREELCPREAGTDTQWSGEDQRPSSSVQEGLQTTVITVLSKANGTTAWLYLTTSVGAFDTAVSATVGATLYVGQSASTNVWLQHSSVNRAT